MPQDFKNFGVWKESADFATLIYAVVKVFPREERFGLTSRLQRASVSISGNIAEGCGRSSDPDFVRFLCMSFGSVKGCENLLFLSKRLGYLGEETLNMCLEKSAVIGKMLNNFIRYLKKGGVMGSGAVDCDLVEGNHLQSAV